MKLSTSAHARGRVGTLLGIGVMGLLLALTGGEISVPLLCVSGAGTWLAVAWVLSANKDKLVL